MDIYFKDFGRRNFVIPCKWRRWTQTSVSLLSWKKKRKGIVWVGIFVINLGKCLQVENEAVPEETKEESDEEDEDDEESGRIRFKSERKDGAVVRLADASKRRNIPETLGKN